tara:strand:- start:1775 stop:3217 length:1443 start_codon:yes stop_codon:yes gene_type:complete
MAYDSIHTGQTIDNAVTKATDMPGFKTEVANYASLPASPSAGDVYLVIAATTGYPAGFYRYSGSAWVFMGREAAPVDSVNTQTGAVVLDADDIDDTSTTHRFTNASDISRLSAVEAGAQVNTVDSVNTQTGAVVLDADDISDATTTNKFTNAADISRLSAVEAGADVTDTDNVTNAGALMDSEVTNLAQVKAFDSSDYATAAQGSTADSALQSVAGDSNPTLGANLDLATYDIVTESSDRPIELAPHGTGGVVLKGNEEAGADNTGKITLNCEQNSHGVTIKAPTHSDLSGGSYTLTLPVDDGSASQALTTDGSGNLSWSTPAGSYGNSDVDTHLNTSSASTDQVLSWNGSDYAWTDQIGRDGQLGITIDGAGSAITTGSKGFLRAPFDCTITAAQLLADQSGSIVIDVTKDTYANFPPTTLTDSICASALPTLSSSQKSEDTTLTGWTTSVSKGDVLGFVVNSATTVTRVSLNLVVTKT